MNLDSFLAKAKVVLFSALIGLVAGILVVKFMKLCNILATQRYFHFLGHSSIAERKIAFICFFLTALILGTLSALHFKPPRR